MTIPAYLPYFVFAGTAATLIAILYGLNWALVDAAWPASERTRAFRVSAVILLLDKPQDLSEQIIRFVACAHPKGTAGRVSA